MNKLFELRPISDPPKEDGYYGIKLNGESQELPQLFYTIYFKDGEWFEDEDLEEKVCTKNVLGWIAPLAEPVEGMRWVPAGQCDQIIGKIYFAKLPTEPVIMGTGRFVKKNTWKWSDCLSGSVQLGELLILDESSTPSAREEELAREAINFAQWKEDNGWVVELVGGRYVAWESPDHVAIPLSDLYKQFKQHNL